MVIVGANVPLANPQLALNFQFSLALVKTERLLHDIHVIHESEECGANRDMVNLTRKVLVLSSHRLHQFASRDAIDALKYGFV